MTESLINTRLELFNQLASKYFLAHLRTGVNKMVRFRNQSIDPSLDLPYKTFLVPRLTGTEFCANAFVPSVSSTTY